MRKCTLEYCDRKHRAKGFCSAHYHQVIIGKALRPLRIRYSKDALDRPSCGFERCGKTVQCKGLCSSHYRQLQSGLPLKPLNLIGECESCGRTAQLVSDHDHLCCSTRVTCGACFRGLICHDCNLTLGLVNDDPMRLTKLIDYLMKTNQVTTELLSGKS